MDDRKCCLIELLYCPVREALQTIEAYKFSDIINGWKLRHEELPSD